MQVNTRVTIPIETGKKRGVTRAWKSQETHSRPLIIYSANFCYAVLYFHTRSSKYQK